jgi:competence protein ComEC
LRSEELAFTQPKPTSADIRAMHVRVPPPLGCAIAFATLIAMCGSPPRTVPDGARPDDRGDDRIAGVVGGPVVRTPFGIGAPLHVDGSIVWIWSEREIEPGQRIVVVGRLRTPRGSWSPGASDRATLVASRGAEWELTASHVEIVGEDDGVTTRIWRWANRTQRDWSKRITLDNHDAAAAALTGIVTGERAGVPDELDQRWRVVGIYHVLSVSGLHLAVVAGLAFILLCKLVAASPWGGRVRPAQLAAPIAIVLAIAYTLITGAQLATIRALVVVTIVFAGKAFDRPLRLVDALGLAAIAILVWRPQDLYDPSFQLSFVAALTLALRPRKPRLVKANLAHRIVHWLARGISTSAWVAITTAPITALHFQQVAIGGVVGNLVLTPLVELIALPLGLAGVLIGDAGALLISAATWIIELVDAVAELLAVAMPTGAIAVASPAVMVMLVVIGIWLASRPRRSRKDAIAWLALCVTWTLALRPAALGALRVTFVDVGQGDAAIVELPDGAVWLVDAGGVANARNVAAASAPGKTIERTLAVYGHDAIDLAIISHPHPDHYLGLAGLTVPVRELWFSDLTASKSPLPSLAEVAEILAARGTRLASPPLGTWRQAGVELSVWAPRFAAVAGARERAAPDPVRSVNDNSLVVTIRYAGRTVLFAGDLEAEGEALLVEAGIGEVDVVKVAHHGSRTSSSAALVDATRPELAVISCGVANAFGFPSPAVVERWRQAGTAVERTDLAGAITVTVPADGTLGIERFVPRHASVP